MSPRVLVASLVVLFGTLGCSSYAFPPLSVHLSRLPARLSSAGLYGDAELTKLSPGVQERQGLATVFSP